MDQQTSLIDLGEAIVNKLISIRQDLLLGDGPKWSLTSEHVLHHIETSVSRLLGSQFGGYLAFLRSKNLTKCSFTVADSFRYIAADDFAVDPELFESVVAAAQTQVFHAYLTHLKNVPPASFASVNRELIAPWIEKCVFFHLESFSIPSKFGNAAIREAIAQVHEDVVASVLPSLNEQLGWNYSSFLRSKDISTSYCHANWENGFRFFDLDATFPAIWLEYLSALGHFDAGVNKGSVTDDLRNAWSSQISKSVWKNP